jgi:hypothetical protein
LLILGWAVGATADRVVGSNVSKKQQYDAPVLVSLHQSGDRAAPQPRSRHFRRFAITRCELRARIDDNCYKSSTIPLYLGCPLIALMISTCELAGLLQELDHIGQKRRRGSGEAGGEPESLPKNISAVCCCFTTREPHYVNFK